MDNFEYQALRDMVKEGGEDIIEKFEKKFKEIKNEGMRRGVPAALQTESDPDHLHETHYTESELEAMYMGKESEARKRFQKQGLYQQRQSFS